MTLLILGASSQLGQSLVSLAEQRGLEWIGTAWSNPQAIPGRSLSLLDLTDIEAVLAAFDLWRPRHVIFCSAAQPGAPEALLYALNARAAGAVAEACEALGSRLCYLSTDVIHSGQEAPYADNAEPRPLTAYGRSKAEGEGLVLERCQRGLCVRTSLIARFAVMDRGTRSFADRLSKGQAVSLFTDVWRQPIEVTSLARAVLSLSVDHEGETGSINVAGSELMSRAEYGRLMLDFWQVEGRERVLERPVAEVTEAPVPRDLRLSLTRARALGLSLPGLSERLRHFRETGTL